MPFIVYKIGVGELQTNCYILKDKDSENCAVIDPGGDYRKIKAFIDSKHFIPLFIVNTHGHADHILANEKFKLPVYIHEKDADFLSDPQKNLSQLPFIMREKQVRLLKDRDIINLNNLDLKVIHTPGHTPGSICLLCSGVLFSGDTLFASGIGRTDFPYGSESALLDSIKNKLFILDGNIKVYPGHGPETTIAREKRENLSV